VVLVLLQEEAKVGKAELRRQEAQEQEAQEQEAELVLLA
jgi:hypothetical protein